MFIYLDAKNILKLEQTFKDLLSQPDNFLALNDDTYRLMIFFTLASKNLSKYAPSLYEEYLKHHKYNCEVQNNIAIHYFNLENYTLSAKYVKNTIEYFAGKKCLNLELIKILNEMGFLQK